MSIRGSNTIFVIQNVEKRHKESIVDRSDSFYNRNDKDLKFCGLLQNTDIQYYLYLMKRNLLGLIFFLYTITVSFAQNDILVELNDSETAEPIPFATIRFKGTSRGLVADYYGQFRLPYKSIDSLPVIIITSMGYKTKEVNANTLSSNTLNKIQMIPQIESLDAVVLNVSKRDKIKSISLTRSIKEIKRMSAYEIVNKAIHKIPENLNTNPHSYIGYYRDYQMVDKEYNNLNEGILEQFDAGILTDKISGVFNQNVFYSFNQNQDYAVNKELALSYNNSSKYVESANIIGFGGNELTILNVHNPIRNYSQNTFSYVYQMNKDFLLNHNFQKGDITFIEDDAVIQILLTLKKVNKKRNPHISEPNSIEISDQHRVAGSITISLEDFSIHDFTYTMYDLHRSNPLFNVQLQYRKQDKKMYLNYITFNNRFVLDGDNVFRENTINYDKSDNVFDIKFNNRVDAETVKSRNFTIKYKGRKVFIESVKVTDEKSVLISIADFDNLLTNIKTEDIADLEFKIKRLKDVNGAKIYKPTRLIAYQFREFFVQEVFTDKAFKTYLSFISKESPLNLAKKNNLDNKDFYIINSPLRVVDTSSDE